jgi:hypothetical protein
MTLAFAEPFRGVVFLDRAVSQDAHDVRKIRDEYQNADNSFLSQERRHQILDGLATALIEGAQGNWDAFQAFRANANAMPYTFEFLNLLPGSLPFPEIAIDNDGDIAIEWDYGSRRVISVRVAPDGTLHFAALVGYSSNHGTEPLQDRIPDTIAWWINRVVNDPSV